MEIPCLNKVTFPSKKKIRDHTVITDHAPDHTLDHSLQRDHAFERNNRNDHFSDYSVPKLACDLPDLKSHSHLPMSKKKKKT